MDMPQSVKLMRQSVEDYGRKNSFDCTWIHLKTPPYDFWTIGAPQACNQWIISRKKTGKKMNLTFLSTEFFIFVNCLSSTTKKLKMGSLNQWTTQQWRHICQFRIFVFFFFNSGIQLHSRLFLSISPFFVLFKNFAKCAKKRSYNTILLHTITQLTKWTTWRTNTANFIKISSQAEDKV